MGDHIDAFVSTRVFPALYWISVLCEWLLMLAWTIA